MGLSVPTTPHTFSAGYLAEAVNPANHKHLRDLVPGRVNYDGQHPIANIHASLSRIIRDYRNLYLGQEQRAITDFLYLVAANEIVDHRISTWQSGGQLPGKLKKTGHDIQQIRQTDRLRGVNLSLPS